MFHYKKILIIGCPGAGKSTFARRLSEILLLPLFHMDSLYWKKDCTHITRDELKEKLNRIFMDDAWIIDGNYRNTLEMRIKECDLIFFFDLPADICLDGIMHRESRPDMPCDLPVDDELISFVKNFGTDSKPIVLERMNKFPDKKVVTFSSREEADAYLTRLEDSTEYWDVYDMHRNKTGKKQIRGRQTAPGSYRMVIHTALFNSDGKMLIQQRQPFKQGFSGLWDITAGGSSLSGETSQQAAHRELMEEVGIDYDFSQIRPHYTINFSDGFDDVYVIQQDINDITKLNLQYEEVKAVKWADIDEIFALTDQGRFVPYTKGRIQLIFDIMQNNLSYDF